MEDIRFAGVTISALLSVVLGVVYRTVGQQIPDRWRSLIAVLIGLGLGGLNIPYQGLEWTVPVVVDNLIAGGVVGATSVGLYELQRTVTRPR